jgi:hypothetical protein
VLWLLGYEPQHYVRRVHLRRVEPLTLSSTVASEGGVSGSAGAFRRSCASNRATYMHPINMTIHHPPRCLPAPG